MEKFARVPPENISRSERRGLPRNNADREVLSIPADGMCAASLNTAKITAVIISFFLISGDFTVFEKN